MIAAATAKQGSQNENKQLNPPVSCYLMSLVNTQTDTHFSICGQ